MYRIYLPYFLFVNTLYYVKATFSEKKLHYETDNFDL